MLHAMVSSENPKITALRGVPDPRARARQAQAFITQGETTLREARQVRDDAIRAAHTDGDTIDTIAAQVGVRRNIVVDACRRR